MFNIIGVTWMVIILPWILPILSNVMQTILGIGDPFNSDPSVAAESIPLALAGFHTFFNLTNVLLLLGFVPWLVKVAIWSVKGVEDEDDIKLRHISTAVLTPELATIELQKEAAHFGEIVSRMSTYTAALMNNTKEKKQRKLLKKLKKYEEITDKLEIEITEYITKLADREITAKTSKRLRSILNICNDLERIGDIYYQISKTLEQKIDNKVYFLPEQRNNLNEMIELIDNAFAEMLSNLSSPSYDKVSKERAVQLEKQINAFRDKLREENTQRLGNPEYNVKSAMVYNNMFSSLERVGDHIINVSESVVGEI
jgi:phosphate:Na+ symporter